MLLFRNQTTLFMEGAGVHSVREFWGTMSMNGWESREEESWEWKPVNPVFGRSQLMQGFICHKELDFILRKRRPKGLGR